MKKTITTILPLLISIFTFGQAANVDKIAGISGDTLTGAKADTSWKTGGFIGINFSQVSLNNWAQGGENSIAIGSNANVFANYAKGKTQWDNSLTLAYALLKTGKTPVRKSDDQIDLTSKFGYRIGDSKWFYSALLNFKSQFADGYAYPNDSVVISHFLAPGYVIIALGVNYKPVEYFEMFFSPATGKVTLVNDQDLADLGAYGVDPAVYDLNGNVTSNGKTSRTEFGAYMNFKFKKDIFTNVTLASKLELFNNYTDKDKDNAKKIDVNWETGLLMKVNKFMTASILTQLIYDANTIERTQFKEVIGVGV
ncbi:MAG TPA: DUF3078 domain-containing protein, partial [Bacteroidia bacterium]|nr:DUF3078 domain-containing protein [Bacteroidia bacterium]